MPRRPRLRVVASRSAPADLGGPQPLLTGLQRKLLRDLAHEIEARVDADEPYDPAGDDAQPQPPRRRR
jgi:hypothetical protein